MAGKTLQDRFEELAIKTSVPPEKQRQVRCVFMAGALSALLNVTEAHAYGGEDEAVIAMIRECAEFNAANEREFGTVQ